jgi:lipopolysaccharide export system permease protein
MKKLHKFVIKSFIGPFFATFFVCVFVLLMQFLWQYINELVGKGLDWSVVTELLLYAAMGLIPLAFPLAMLLASIMTFGNLGENYELVAMKSSGISLFRVMKPLMVLAIMLTIGAFFFSNNILPKTNLKFYSLLYSVRKQKPEMVIKEGVFSNDLGSFSIKVDRKSKVNNMLYNIMVYDHTGNKGNISVSIADSGKMEVTRDKKFMSVTLYNGHNYIDGEEQNRRNKTYPFRRQTFKKEVININMKGFEFNRMDEKSFTGTSKMLNISQLSSRGDTVFRTFKTKLWKYFTSFNYMSDINRQVSWMANPVDSLRKKNKPKIKPTHEIDFDKTIASLNQFEKGSLYQRAEDHARENSQKISQQTDEIYNGKKAVNSYAMDWHRKFTLSFACLIFFFIGAPLGAIIRKGGLGMPIVISIFMFIAYYVVMILGEKMAKDDSWNMVNGMWLASSVFLPLGIWLTYKAATDSGVMNAESYQMLFKRILGLKIFNWRKKPQ